MIELNVKRDQNIRFLVKKLKKERLKRCVNGGNVTEITKEILREVGERFGGLSENTIAQICRDPNYSLRWLQRSQHPAKEK